MWNKIDFWRMTVVALLLLNGGVLFFLLTQPKPPHPGRRGEGPKHLIIERLHLDAGQTDAYEKLVRQHQNDIRAKEREMHDTKRHLYASLQNAEAPAKDSLAQRIGQLQVDIEHIHFNHFQDIKTLCRPEQMADFNALAGELADYFSRTGRRRG